ncbi:MAG: hypothetical protein J6K88_05735 [Oscillospiraceae bacterium]|nr:hypothetical protein [Oscillospiraceae bacterium]
MAKTDKNAINRLYKAVLKLQTEKECENFFNDICTMQEIEAIAQRLDVACKLLKGKVYTEISADTGASTATVCRVNRCIKYGGGGYKTVVERLDEEEQK